MINEVAVGDPVTAERTNQVIRHVNGTPYRAIFTANGNWTIPAGCHRYKVTLCGGGTYGYPFDIESGVPGSPGARSPMVSKVFSALETGSTIAIEVGRASLNSASLPEHYNGTATKFGTMLFSNGGTASGQVAGTHNGEIVHSNELFCTTVTVGGSPYFLGYGSAGKGGQRFFTGSVSQPGWGEPGGPGICVIEW